MDFIFQNDDNKHLIVLVHGLNGGDGSWIGTNERFVETLSKNNLVRENFDLTLRLRQTNNATSPML